MARFFSGTNFPSRRRQSGAALFVGLMMLILLALIGVAGMQATTMQERMVGNYRIANSAFQSAEWQVRAEETTMNTLIRGGGTYLADVNDCTMFDRVNWAAATSGSTPASGFRSAQLTSCTPGTGTEYMVEDINPTYSLVAVDHERREDGTVASPHTATVVIETVYITP